MPSSTSEQIIAGRYRIIETHQVGGGLVVYLAHDELTGKMVRVRELVASEVTESFWNETLKGWQKSLKVSRQCSSSEHIIKSLTIEQNQLNGNIYLITENITGTCLPDPITTKPADIEQVLLVMRSAAMAIQDLAEAGITHRDIKPANIIICEDGIRLGGLDIAQIASDTAILQASEAHPGTPAYKSPEQAMFTGLLDQRSDIYALGLVAYEMLTGRRYTQDHLPAHVHRPDMPRPLSNIVMRCLEKDPETRYQTAQTLIHDLGQVEQESVSGQLKIAARPISGPRFWQTSAILAVVILAALLIRASTTRALLPQTGEGTPTLASQATAESTSESAGIQTVNIESGDAFEPDETEPAPLAIGELQAHTFSYNGDIDRATIQVNQGWTYTIAASNLSAGVDTVLEVLVDGQSYVNDNSVADSLASRVEFTAMNNSVALITITNLGTYGEEQGYYLSAQQVASATITPNYTQVGTTPSRTPRPTYTATPIATATSTTGATRTPTRTIAPTSTRTPTITSTPSVTPTPSNTPTVTATATPYRTPLPARTVGPVQE